MEAVFSIDEVPLLLLLYGGVGGASDRMLLAVLLDTLACMNRIYKM